MKSAAIDYFPYENVLVMDFTHGRVSSFFIAGQALKSNNFRSFPKLKIVCVFDKKATLPAEIENVSFASSPNYYETVGRIISHSFIDRGVRDPSENKADEKVVTLGDALLNAIRDSVVSGLKDLIGSNQKFVTSDIAEPLAKENKNSGEYFRISETLRSYDFLFRDTVKYSTRVSSIENNFIKASTNNDLAEVFDTQLIICDYSYAMDVTRFSLRYNHKALEVVTYAPFYSGMYTHEDKCIPSELIIDTNVYITKFDMESYAYSARSLESTFFRYRANAIAGAMRYDRAVFSKSYIIMIEEKQMEEIRETLTKKGAMAIIPQLEIPFSYIAQKAELSKININQHISRKTPEELSRGEIHGINILNYKDDFMILSIGAYSDDLIRHQFSAFFKIGAVIDWFGDILSLDKISLQNYVFTNVKTGKDVKIDAALYLAQVKNGFVKLFGV